MLKLGVTPALNVRQPHLAPSPPPNTIALISHKYEMFTRETGRDFP